jgi:hypothetical protein
VARLRVRFMREHAGGGNTDRPFTTRRPPVHNARMVTLTQHATRSCIPHRPALHNTQVAALTQHAKTTLTEHADLPYKTRRPPLQNRQSALTQPAGRPYTTRNPLLHTAQAGLAQHASGCPYTTRKDNPYRTRRPPIQNTQTSLTKQAVRPYTTRRPALHNTQPALAYRTGRPCTTRKWLPLHNTERQPLQNTQTTITQQTGKLPFHTTPPAAIVHKRSGPPLYLYVYLEQRGELVDELLAAGRAVPVAEEGNLLDRRARQQVAQLAHLALRPWTAAGWRWLGPRPRRKARPRRNGGARTQPTP